MNMTKKEIINAMNFITPLKLNKFEKSIRIALYKNYVEFNKIQKDVNETISVLREKMFEDKQEDGRKVQELREKLNLAKNQEEVNKINKEASKYKDFLKTESEFIQCYNDEYNKEVDCNIEKIDRDEFIDGLIESNVDFTVKDIEQLNFIFK